MSRFFSKNIMPRCAYCQFSMNLNENYLLCMKNGPVEADSKCRRYKYDPFKRVPKTLNLPLGNYKAEDFTL